MTKSTLRNSTDGWKKQKSMESDPMYGRAIQAAEEVEEASE